MLHTIMLILAFLLLITGATLFLSAFIQADLLLAAYAIACYALLVIVGGLWLPYVL